MVVYSAHSWRMQWAPAHWSARGPVADFCAPVVAAAFRRTSGGVDFVGGDVRGVQVGVVGGVDIQAVGLPAAGGHDVQRFPLGGGGHERVRGVHGAALGRVGGADVPQINMLPNVRGW